MSREIVLFIAASWVDGFIAKEDDDLEWLMETEGEGRQRLYRNVRNN